MTRCPRCLSPVATYRLTTYAPGCGTPERIVTERACACPKPVSVQGDPLIQPARVGGTVET